MAENGLCMNVKLELGAYSLKLNPPTWMNVFIDK
jgi:hypothetical protein